MATLGVLVDYDDMLGFTSWMKEMGRKLSRETILPILKQNLEPMVQSEKLYLASHDKSGALSMSLSARSGSGDRPGTVSAFSTPTATAKQLQSTWGARGRAQQKGWAAALKTKGRKRVFYGNILHQGHRVVRRMASGELKTVGYASAVPFAQQAVDAMGDAQAEAAAVQILDVVFGK